MSKLTKNPLNLSLDKLRAKQLKLQLALPKRPHAPTFRDVFGEEYTIKTAGRNRGLSQADLNTLSETSYQGNRINLTDVARAVILQVAGDSSKPELCATHAEFFTELGRAFSELAPKLEEHNKTRKELEAGERELKTITQAITVQREYERSLTKETVNLIVSEEAQSKREKAMQKQIDALQAQLNKDNK